MTISQCLPAARCFWHLHLAAHLQEVSPLRCAVECTGSQVFTDSEAGVLTLQLESRPSFDEGAATAGLWGTFLGWLGCIGLTA